MVRSFKAQTMEVLPAGWLQSLGFRSIPFPRPIPRFNSRNFFQWGRREQKVDGVTVYGEGDGNPRIVVYSCEGRFIH
ncbi:hypothetical protein COLO4_22810 [Corchorus olitorius]|uniref:Uncharacterized protein n=1 Tax=Corchorus olitorius TaxID=93759 RepID=A0A1R3IJN6_9ROSI|nr:hypothetical protein COLO4_22810 [Corchorus olitorius]